jgi:hypothetical protein
MVSYFIFFILDILLSLSCGYIAVRSIERNQYWLTLFSSTVSIFCFIVAAANLLVYLILKGSM